MGINALLNTKPSKYELLVKTLDPIPSSVVPQSSFKIIESIIDPFTIEVDLGLLPPIDDTIPLRGPNFKIATRENSSIPSNFKNYDQILTYPELFTAQLGTQIDRKYLYLIILKILSILVALQNV